VPPRVDSRCFKQERLTVCKAAASTQCQRLLNDFGVHCRLCTVSVLLLSTTILCAAAVQPWHGQRLAMGLAQAGPLCSAVNVHLIGR
jgi:hypothetical protein